MSETVYYLGESIELIEGIPGWRDKRWAICRHSNGRLWLHWRDQLKDEPDE